VLGRRWEEIIQFFSATDNPAHAAIAARGTSQALRRIRAAKVARLEKERLSAAKYLGRSLSAIYDPSPSVAKFMEELPLGESREETLPDAQIVSPTPRSPLKSSIHAT
jgi:hypothetical protein